MFSNVCDIVQPLKEEEPTTLPDIGYEDERGFSTQVIIAALNEEPGIGKTIIELGKSLQTNRFLVVDGKSQDRTVEIAKNCGADIVFQDGTGKGDAISKALEYTDLGIDFIVFTDADFTYPAEYVPKMIEILKRNPDVGMVCGNRFSQHIDSTALRGSFYFGNKLLAFAHNLLNGVNMRDPLTGLRVIRAEILRNRTLKSKGFDVEVELNSAVERKGFKIVEVPITYRERLGEKKLKLKHGTSILKRILIESTY